MFFQFRSENLKNLPRNIDIGTKFPRACLQKHGQVHKKGHGNQPVIPKFHHARKILYLGTSYFLYKHKTTKGLQISVEEFGRSYLGKDSRNSLGALRKLMLSGWWRYMMMSGQMFFSTKQMGYSIDLSSRSFQRLEKGTRCNWSFHRTAKKQLFQTIICASRKFASSAMGEDGRCLLPVLDLNKYIPVSDTFWKDTIWGVYFGHTLSHIIKGN